MKLNPNAQSALDNVSVKQAALKAARALFVEEQRVELERKLEPFTKDRDVAVKLADEAGVPRTQIGKALGTANYKTVLEILGEFGIAPRTQTGEIPNRPWTAYQTPEGWRVSIANLGPAGLTGSAIVKLDDEGQLERVDGDYFVIGGLYTQGYADEVIQCISQS